MAKQEVLMYTQEIQNSPVTKINTSGHIYTSSVSTLTITVINYSASCVTILIGGRVSYPL